MNKKIKVPMLLMLLLFVSFSFPKYTTSISIQYVQYCSIGGDISLFY